MKIKSILSVTLILHILSAQYCAAWDNPEKLYEKADKSYLKGDYEKAFGYCNSLLDEFRVSQYRNEANLLAGLALLKLGRYDEAKGYFAEVINQKSAGSLKEEAYLGLADSYFLAGSYKEAAGYYQGMLLYFPDGNYNGVIEQRLKEIENSSNPKTSESPSLYTIQIGSFKNKNNAKKIYNRFKGKGYNASLIEAKGAASLIYKVRIGKFKSSQDAEDFAKKLKRQGYETKICEWQE